MTTLRYVDGGFTRAAMKRMELDAQHRVYPHLMLMDEINGQNEDFLTEFERDPSAVMRTLRVRLAHTINDPLSRMSAADIYGLYYALHATLLANNPADHDRAVSLAHIREILREKRIPGPNDFLALSNAITAGGRNWEALYEKYRKHHENNGSRPI